MTKKLVYSMCWETQLLNTNTTVPSWLLHTILQQIQSSVIQCSTTKNTMMKRYHGWGRRGNGWRLKQRSQFIHTPREHASQPCISSWLMCYDYRFFPKTTCLIKRHKRNDLQSALNVQEPFEALRGRDMNFPCWSFSHPSYSGVAQC